MMQPSPRKPKLEPWELNLFELPDSGVSLLDLPDAGGITPLWSSIRHPVGSASQFLICGSASVPRLAATVGAAAADPWPAIVLDARRPTIEAHLCRWLAFRILGFVGGGPYTFDEEWYHGTRSGRVGGRGWCLLAGDRAIAAWPPHAEPVAGIDNRFAALVALVKHCPAGTEGRARISDARHP